MERGVRLSEDGAIPLSAVRATERSIVGGKALELARLTRAGLPVPAGVVVPVEVFRSTLEGAGLLALAEEVQRDTTRAQELHDAILALKLPHALSTAWVRIAARLGARLAVRSSGVEEDGVERSFAGLHDTVLSVAPADVPAAVLRCWSSLYTRRALTYRGGGGPAPCQLAVVIQEMIEPRCSGVMFTINPLNGSWREMVVEAVWGLGEGLVSGQIAPHWYLVRRPRTLPRPFRRVAERVRLQVIEEDLPELSERFVGAPGGSVLREATPSELVHRRTLERSTLRRLCRLGLRIERALGAPQDVEWALDHQGALRVLQARPITAAGAPRERGDVLWTRRFVGERWPQPATPLGWSLLEPVISWFIAYPETQARYLGGGPALKLVSGRPYINATVFRHLAFKLPGAPAPRFMLELIPPDEESAWRRRFAVAPDLAVYGSIFRKTLEERRWRRFRWNPLTNPEAWARFQVELADQLPALSRPASSPAGGIDKVQAQLQWVREYVGIHICSLLFANISWQLLEGALNAWLPEQRGLMEGLTTCPAGNLTVETNQALYALATAASEADLEALAQDQPTSPAFADALARFLERFGHRSESSWELMAPRWRHDPGRLVPLLRAQQGSASIPPWERARAQEARYNEAIEILHGAIRGPRLAVLQRLVWDTRRYLLLRENQRFWFDHLLDAMQQTLLGLGAHGVEVGWLEERGDVALLTWPELQRLVRDPQAAALERSATLERVEARRAQRLRDAATEPPTFLAGDALGPSPPPSAQRLQGLGISPGRVRGPVRVLRSVAEGHRLRSGDVLVTRAVDPGWTPLFLTAGAVVLELGSVLSHGAVIAREYEVPAVVNIDDVTRRLSEGQEVTVDGHRGVVWIHTER